MEKERKEDTKVNVVACDGCGLHIELRNDDLVGNRDNKVVEGGVDVKIALVDNKLISTRHTTNEPPLMAWMMRVAK